MSFTLGKQQGTGARGEKRRPEPGREAPFFCDGLQFPPPANLTFGPAGKGDMFTEPSFSISSKTTEGGFGAQARNW